MKSIEVLGQIEQNLKNYKYANTTQIHQELLKLMSQMVQTAVLIQVPQDQGALHHKVVQFHLHCDLLFSEAGLLVKEIYVVQANQKSQAPQTENQTKRIAQSIQDKKIAQLEKQLNSLKGSTAKPIPQQPVKKPQNLMDVPMTPAEKNQLKDSIPMLTLAQQNGILKIVQDSCPQSGKGEVFEFELDMLPVRKCRELEKYVEDCIKENKKKAKRKETDKQRRAKQRESKQVTTPKPPV